jgi:FkbM family methyltransferase
MNRAEFTDRIASAATRLEARKPVLQDLGTAGAVTIYSYGIRGQDLALQLRAKGISCAIFDNAPAARDKAARDGFEVATTPHGTLPLLVAAGQNQVSILDELTEPAFSLADTLYAFDLRNSYGPARAFSAMPLDQAEALFDRYERLEPDCRQDFIDVLAYRASLDVRQTNGSRRPMSEMWTPPEVTPPMTSFCDVGAYDGDTLTSMKVALPHLVRSFTVEPGHNFIPQIAAAAARNGLENRNYPGAAWDRPAHLKADLLFNGMFAIKEDKAGDIAADRLDTVTDGETYDYVKYDVESAERQALKGSLRILNSARCIAIAGYHLPNDLVELPILVEALLEDSGWRCSFRHYSQSFDDSIFYFHR